MKQKIKKNTLLKTEEFCDVFSIIIYYETLYYGSIMHIMALSVFHPNLQQNFLLPHVTNLFK